VSAKLSIFRHCTHLGTADSNSMGSSDTFACNLAVLQPVPLDLKHNIFGANYSDHNWVYVIFISSLTNSLTDKWNGWLVPLSMLIKNIKSRQQLSIYIYIYIYIYINLKSVTCLLCHKVLGMITKHNKSALFYVQRLLFSRYPNASSLDAWLARPDESVQHRRLLLSVYTAAL